MATNPVPAPTSTYRDVILKVASDPSFDVEKLERLVALQEAAELADANEYFNNALARAQGEMGPISRDMENPQTRSKYASYAQLDGEIRPIYTKYGFGVQFNEEPSGDAKKVHSIGYLSCGKIIRRFETWMPIVSTGLRGATMMNEQHAYSAAKTYARRALLTDMFNLATIDTDGNLGPREPQRPAAQRQEREAQERQQPQAPEPPMDPETGEVSPHAVSREKGEPWQQWGARLMAGIHTAADDAEIDAWVFKNDATLKHMKEDVPKMSARLDEAITKERQRVKQPAT